jgi:hypothetical protein
LADPPVVLGFLVELAEETAARHAVLVNDGDARASLRRGN